MPTFTLQNEGEKVGANEKGDMDKMKIDNMLCLKLNEIDEAMPNADERRSFAIPPAKKKP